MSLYAFSVWLHIIAAATWVGSMVFFAAVAVPVLRRSDMRALAPRLIALLGARFRVLGWVSLSVLLITGVANLHFRGVTWSLFASPAFWASPFGRPLGYKLSLVGFVVLATLAHELLSGTRATSVRERDPSAARALRERRRASWLGRVVLLASLAILFFAAALVRGFV
jgi:uncharacterized membrane protein